MTLEYVAFIDFETTGLDTVNDLPVEFAAIVYDPIRKLYVKTYEEFFAVPYTDTSKDMLQKLCKIYDEYIEFAYDPQVSQFKKFVSLIEQKKITTLVAHNAEFDKAFFNKACLLFVGILPEVRWIDSVSDYPWPEEIQARRLIHLAAEHGFLNPFAHRAYSDCLTLYGLTKLYEWNDILAYASIPTVRYRAVISYDDRHLAKEKGFHWDGAKRIWWRDFKKTDDLPSIIESIGFPCRVEAVVDACDSIAEVRPK